MGVNFPDRVRKAMQQPASGEHPSADLLNAYAEHTLSPAESQEVLEHLSACPGCRDVVYLACGAMEVAEEEERVVARAAASPMKAAAGLPVPKKRLRWGTYAVPIVAVLVVASVLLVEPFRARHKNNLELAKAMRQQNEALQSQPQASPSPAPKPEQKVDTTTAALAPAKRRDEVRAKSTNATKLTEDALALKKQAAPAEEKFAPSAGIAADSNIPAAPRSAQKDALAQAGDKATSPVVGGAAPTIETESTLVGTAQPTNQLASGASGRVSQRSMSMAASTKAALSSPWRVTRGGSLEHFVADAWRSAATAPGGPFLSVTNFGKEVWAAANNLALYHSGDDGVHWERLTLPAEISGEIVQVRFTTVLDGMLSTSNGQQWASHDGGKTWAMQ